MLVNIQIETTERDALLQLLDMCVKAHGFKVAEAAVILGKKIAAAPTFEPAQPVPPEVPNEQLGSNS